MKNQFLLIISCLLFLERTFAHPLFKIEGIELGKTVVSDLQANLRYNNSDENEWIELDNIRFFYTGKNRTFYSIVLQRAQRTNQFEAWPATWAHQGIIPSITQEELAVRIGKKGFRLIFAELTELGVSLRRIEGTFVSADRRVLTLKFDFDRDNHLVRVIAFGMPRPE